MARFAVNRTACYPVEILLEADTPTAVTISEVPEAPADGIVVCWDLLNAETTAGRIIRARLGSVPVSAPGVSYGNAVPLDAGRAYGFVRPEEEYHTEDQTAWDTLQLQAYGGAWTASVVVTVLLPPGVSP